MTTESYETLMESVTEAIHELERIEQQLKVEGGQEGLRREITDIRSDLASTAISTAYAEEVRKASVGDTLLLDEVNNRVQNLNDE